MNSILLKNPLLPHELYRLLTEFPQYQLTIAQNDNVGLLSEEQRSEVEIIYGDKLSSKELSLLPQLRWIHAPSPYLEEMCVKDIRIKGNVLISSTKEENIEQIGEFAISGILAFTKNLFRWHDADAMSLPLYEKEWKESIWSTTSCKLLQVGLGMIGTEIARRARQLGFEVWGINDPASFHPYCHQIHSMKDLHSLLPVVDIVCLSWPRDQDSATWFKRDEMDLMKKDAALLVFGSGSVIDLNALAQPEVTSKLRGIFLDARFKDPIPAESSLWSKRNVLITPGAAVYPKAETGQAFRTFLYNLRQFLRGNFSDMKNLSAHPLSFSAEALEGEQFY